jgi:hypothetical protein
MSLANGNDTRYSELQTKIKETFDADQTLGLLVKWIDTGSADDFEDADFVQGFFKAHQFPAVRIDAESEDASAGVFTNTELEYLIPVTVVAMCREAVGGSGSDIRDKVRKAARKISGRIEYLVNLQRSNAYEFNSHGGVSENVRTSIRCTKDGNFWYARAMTKFTVRAIYDN